MRLNKKEMIETAMKAFLPEGVTLSKMQPLTNEQYDHLLALEDAEEFSLNYKTFLGKIIKVTDGDTLRAAVWFNNTPTKFIFRLGGIDTPETRKGEAKEFGKKVKEIMTTMIEGKMVKI
jgi:endonuclease YncB( thermonuclease family)